MSVDFEGMSFDMYYKSYHICLIVMARVTFMLPYMCSNYGCLYYSCTPAVSTYIWCVVWERLRL